MEKKINVLVIPSDKTGVGKFRSIDPHIFLQTANLRKTFYAGMRMCCMKLN